jgi:hypothetical protein
MEVCQRLVMLTLPSPTAITQFAILQLDGNVSYKLISVSVLEKNMSYSSSLKVRVNGTLFVSLGTDRLTDYYSYSNRLAGTHICLIVS